MIKDFDELYYLTSPEIFVKNHFPEDKKWQLLDKPISKSEFRKTPIFYSSYYELGMSNLSPAKGLIKLKMKNPIEFRFNSEQKFNEATITLNDDKNSFYSRIETINGNEHSIKFKFDKTGEYELSLFIEGRAVATYKIVIK